MIKPTRTHLISEFSVPFAKPDRQRSVLSMRSFLAQEWESWLQSSNVRNEKLELRLTASWNGIKDFLISKKQIFPVTDGGDILSAWMADMSQFLENLPPKDNTCVCLVICRMVKSS